MDGWSTQTKIDMGSDDKGNNGFMLRPPAVLKV